jgi:hypothetical protein
VHEQPARDQSNQLAIYIMLEIALIQMILESRASAPMRIELDCPACDCVSESGRLDPQDLPSAHGSTETVSSPNHDIGLIWSWFYARHTVGRGHVLSHVGRVMSCATRKSRRAQK